MNFDQRSAFCTAFFCCVLFLTSCSSTPKGDAPAVRNTETEETVLKSLADQQAVLPKDSPKLEAPLEKVIGYYEIHNRFDLAEKYLNQLVVCREANWNWERLSMALSEQGKYDQAIEEMKKAVAMIEAKNNTDNTAAVYIRYAKLLEKAGRPEEAKPLRAKAHEMAPLIKNSTLRWH